jgi:hypothetical protein
MMNKLKVWRQGLGQKGTLKFDKEQALAKLIGIVKSSNLKNPTCKRKRSNQGKLVQSVHFVQSKH